MKTEQQLKTQFEQIRASLDERGRRRWAASEAMAIGYGGIAMVHRATGIVPSTIGRGLKELHCSEKSDVSDGCHIRRVRAPGAGRPPKTKDDPELLGTLERLVDPTTRGDPESPLRWTCKSLRRLASELVSKGHDVSYRTVGRLLKVLNFSLQGNHKTAEGKQHPDRNAQFEYINEQTQARLVDGLPAVSVDTKKKELVGNYKNGGREYHPKGRPEKVDVHDFAGELGRVSPYGIYDIGDDAGWVSVGISKDTSEFAVQSIRKWWHMMGSESYPDATELFITADCGGSNGYRTRLWKLELQMLADELGIPITVCHFPPGTSKWNKIEHRLFSFITMNWRGQPLRTYQTVVELIASTTTETGLSIQCELDPVEYEAGRKVTDAQMQTINISHHEFHGEWNYTINPRSKRP